MPDSQNWNTYLEGEKKKKKIKPKTFPEYITKLVSEGTGVAFWRTLLNSTLHNVFQPFTIIYTLEQDLMHKLKLTKVWSAAGL